MTAAELGRSSGTSEATAVRLATTLGYPNFPNFIKSLQKEAQRQLSTIERLKLHNIPPSQSGYMTRTIAKDLELAKEGMAADNNDGSLKRLAEEICKSQSVYLIGFRSARCLVQYMEFYLSWFFPKICVPTCETLDNCLTSAPKNSIVIGISFPRYTRQTIESLAFAKQKGFLTAAVTDSMSSPLVKESDIALIAPCSHIAHIDSLLIPLGLINAILIQVAEHLGSVAIRRLEELEATWSEHGTYYYQ